MYVVRFLIEFCDTDYAVIHTLRTVQRSARKNGPHHLLDVIYILYIHTYIFIHTQKQSMFF